MRCLSSVIFPWPVTLAFGFTSCNSSSYNNKQLHLQHIAKPNTRLAPGAHAAVLALTGLEEPPTACRVPLSSVAKSSPQSALVKLQESLYRGNSILWSFLLRTHNQHPPPRQAPGPPLQGGDFCGINSTPIWSQMLSHCSKSARESEVSSTSQDTAFRVHGLIKSTSQDTAFTARCSKYTSQDTVYRVHCSAKSISQDTAFTVHRSIKSTSQGSLCSITFVQISAHLHPHNVEGTPASSGPIQSLHVLLTKPLQAPGPPLQIECYLAAFTAHPRDYTLNLRTQHLQYNLHHRTQSLQYSHLRRA